MLGVKCEGWGGLKVVLCTSVLMATILYLGRSHVSAPPRDTARQLCVLERGPDASKPLMKPTRFEFGRSTLQPIALQLQLTETGRQLRFEIKEQKDKKDK